MTLLGLALTLSGLALALGVAHALGRRYGAEDQLAADRAELEQARHLAAVTNRQMLLYHDLYRAERRRAEAAGRARPGAYAVAMLPVMDHTIDSASMHN